jgi:ABC-type transport system substrate-binding protein
MKRAAMTWTLEVAAALSASGWAQPSATAPAFPEIRFAINTDTSTSMPGNVLRNTFTDEILANVVESLVALKSDLSVAPILADSWDISPDGKQYTFHLRHGVVFHNGTPFTSADVKWSYDYFMKPPELTPGATDMHSRKTIVTCAVTGNLTKPEQHPQRAGDGTAHAFDVACRAAVGAVRDKSNLRVSLDRYYQNSRTNMGGEERVVTGAMPVQQ